jgi:uncharacterized membrane protein YfcA
MYPHFTAGVLAAVLAGSLLAGTLGALMGLGGGVLIIPLLTALGVDVRHAIAASIVAVIATSSGAAASYVRDGLANLRLGLLLSVATTSGALFGAFLNGVLPTRVLFLVFSVVLGSSAVMMYRKRTPLSSGAPEEDAAPRASPGHGRLRLGTSYWDATSGRERRYVPRRVGLGFLMMAVAGAVSGLLGIGSGALKVPAMDLAMELPIKVSTATSNFMIGITALASALVYLGQGRVVIPLVTPVALGVLVGASLGTRLLSRLPAATIRKGFVVVLAALVVEMFWKGVT